MWEKVMTWVMRLLTSLPGLVADVERLWAGEAKAGEKKWVAVENALRYAIDSASAEIAKFAPPGIDSAAASKALKQFSSTVGTAFVTLVNDLHLFPHSAAAQPATLPGRNESLLPTDVSNVQPSSYTVRTSGGGQT